MDDSLNQKKINQINLREKVLKYSKQKKKKKRNPPKETKQNDFQKTQNSHQMNKIHLKPRFSTIYQSPLQFSSINSPRRLTLLMSPQNQQENISHEQNLLVNSSLKTLNTPKNSKPKRRKQYRVKISSQKNQIQNENPQDSQKNEHNTFHPHKMSVSHDLQKLGERKKRIKLIPKTMFRDSKKNNLEANNQNQQKHQLAKSVNLLKTSSPQNKETSIEMEKNEKNVDQPRIQKLIFENQYLLKMIKEKKQENLNLNQKIENLQKKQAQKRKSFINQQKIINLKPENEVENEKFVKNQKKEIQKLKSKLKSFKEKDKKMQVLNTEKEAQIRQLLQLKQSLDENILAYKNQNEKINYEKNTKLQDYQQKYEENQQLKDKINTMNKTLNDLQYQNSVLSVDLKEKNKEIHSLKESKENRSKNQSAKKENQDEKSGPFARNLVSSDNLVKKRSNSIISYIPEKMAHSQNIVSNNHAKNLQNFTNQLRILEQRQLKSFSPKIEQNIRSEENSPFHLLNTKEPRRSFHINPNRLSEKFIHQEENQENYNKKQQKQKKHLLVHVDDNLSNEEKISMLVDAYVPKQYRNSMKREIQKIISKEIWKKTVRYQQAKIGMDKYKINYKELNETVEQIYQRSKNGQITIEMENQLLKELLSNKVLNNQDLNFRLAEDLKRESAIKIQAALRGFFQRKITRIIKKRKNISEEILNTEITYVDMLKKVRDLYLYPLRKLQVIPENKVKIIFSHLENILLVNENMLNKLVERFGSKPWHFEQKIGDIFLELTPFFKIYTNYINNYNQSMGMLNELRSKNGKFSKFLEDVKNLPESQNFPLESLLITPIQRIPRYSLLLDSLFNNTPAQHPDYNNLRQASQKAQEIAEYINEHKRDSENIEKVMMFDKKLKHKKFHLASSPARRFVLDGELLVFEGENVGDMKFINQAHQRNSKITVKNRYCILFNDLLLICKVKNIRSNIFRRTPKKQDDEILHFKSKLDINFRTQLINLFNDETSYKLQKKEHEEMRINHPRTPQHIQPKYFNLFCVHNKKNVLDNDVIDDDIQNIQKNRKIQKSFEIKDIKVTFNAESSQDKQRWVQAIMSLINAAKRRQKQTETKNFSSKKQANFI
ncbi:faciogenital dysplasia protein [Anaeramoeba ignava]|uniref:Faciogenital dysplasia protein n=1 Tax=Anaeramoeba ignava TaxID=1746090 RepID=A0A9Q0RG94_ANAIG|nr:faciogenital dysplasia protein [Anaeramoeba ignava]